MRTSRAFWIVTLCLCVFAGLAVAKEPPEPRDGAPEGEPVATRARSAEGMGSHTERVAGPFETPFEVTRACLECHEEQAHDFMKTVHWLWAQKQEVPGRGGEWIGKRNLINNFCIAVPSNWPRCTSCHAGYGWKTSFTFSDPATVDCLVCHDNTGTYEKAPAGAGMPAKGVDLLKVAQNVGPPTRGNCGACHFFGGGGDHVKHGDLDSTLLAPKVSQDVHMAAEGQGFTCQSCHRTEDHAIAGRAISVSTGGDPRVRCTDCHEGKPHDGKVLNAHVAHVACQTCHISTIAKAQPTKVWWDWSVAGKDIEPGKDRYGLPTYSKKKGAFRWAKDLVPEYAWYNGRADRYVLGDLVDPTAPVRLNAPLGSRDEREARITPFKVMRGKQPYDTKLRTMVVPHLWGGFWDHYDWARAIRDGMEAAGLPYSGEYGFVETKMYWRVNHMVAPATGALGCADCHGRRGRLDWKALGYDGDPQKVGGRFGKKE